MCCMTCEHDHHCYSGFRLGMGRLCNAYQPRQEEEKPTRCPSCGGEYWIDGGPRCLKCYGDCEGTNCDTDGCPAFGMATERRCRCSTNHAGLPVKVWDEEYGLEHE